MLWQLIALLALTSCSHPFRDVSCIGIAPYSPADPWESRCEGWCQDKTDQSEGVTAEDYSQEKTLTELMDLALRTNPTTKKFWAQARADAYFYEQSKAPFYPQVDLYGAADWLDVAVKTKNGANIGGALGRYKTWTREANISWLLFDFGGREFNMMAFKMALFSSNWTHTQSIQNVMNLVLTTYYSFLENQALQKAKEQDLRDSETNLEAAQVRFQAGLGTKVDVLQAQSTLANTQLDLEVLTGDVKIALGQFAVALGLPADSPIKVKDLPTTIPLMKNSKSLFELIEIARESRGDLNATQSQFQQAYFNYQGALAQFWPKINANYNRQNVNYSQSPIIRTHNYDFTLSIDFPIFTGFNDYYRIKATKEKTYQAWAAWAEQESQVTLDVLTAFYNVEVAEQTMKSSEQFLTFAVEAYSLSLESYKVGISSYTDLLTSQSQLSTARSRRIVSMTGYISSLSSLAYAAGILAVTSDSNEQQVNLKEGFDEIQKDGGKPGV